MLENINKNFIETENRLKNALSIWGEYADDIDILFGLKFENEECFWEIKNSHLSQTTSGYMLNLYCLNLKQSVWERFLVNEITFDDITFGGHLLISQGKEGYNSKFHRLLRGLNSNRNLMQVRDLDDISAKPNKTMKQVEVKFWI